MLRTVTDISRNRWNGEATETVTSFVDTAEEYVPYGSGKIALRDGLSTIQNSGTRVLLPSYVPDGLIYPILDAGFRYDFYPVTRRLEPNFDAIKSSFDSDVAAIIGIDYFGFPQPSGDRLRRIAHDNEITFVEDNAHGLLSEHNGVPLGTNGDIGITCVHKCLTVPNGGLLYLQDGSIRDRFDPSEFAGTAERLTFEDCRYLLKKAASETVASMNGGASVISKIVSNGKGSADPTDPIERYQASKTRMSLLTKLSMDRTDPRRLRRIRRQNFSLWRDLVASIPLVEPLFDTLPAGICPSAYPIRCPFGRRLVSALNAGGYSTVYSWPRLPEQARADRSFETARGLSSTIVLLPTTHRYRSSDIERFAEAVEGAANRLG